MSGVSVSLCKCSSDEIIVAIVTELKGSSELCTLVTLTLHT